MEPIPPIIPLLTMIRLTEDVVNETQRRGCAPLETVLFTVRLQMWPAFQKAMSDHVEQLKKYADGVSSSGSVGGFFGRGVSTTDASVATVRHPAIMTPRADPQSAYLLDLQSIRNDIRSLRHVDCSRRRNNDLLQVCWMWYIKAWGLTLHLSPACSD